MKPAQRITLSDSHSIEFGAATWDDAETSVRNRYDSNGRFNPRSSSEVPICDLATMTGLTAQRDLFSRQELAWMQLKISEALARLEDSTGTLPPSFQNR